uniref:Uncharacterized protein n=1 Tax=Utricularia reniformis TaxID=192314 RepID=A0A1Y0AZ49_9LAMI|nr:hypothetical protein AEK19_MT1801 [Utricularia reniformis]ART30409.1 hypothetical protein AEK19_MT1801 [Utricularia reniformis]
MRPDPYYFLTQNGYVIILFVSIRRRRKQGPSLGKTDTLSHSVTTSYVLPYAFGVWVGKNILSDPGKGRRKIEDLPWLEERFIQSRQLMKPPRSMEFFPITTIRTIPTGLTGMTKPVKLRTL